VDSKTNHTKHAVELDRNICNDLAAATSREWLVTNGTGSYAMGTMAGVLTRGYHGLLIAALDPPLGRTLLLANLEETLTRSGEAFPLFTNSWHPGEITPEGYTYVEHFQLDGTTPVWTFAAGSVRLEKRLWMQPGSNTTFVRYTLLEGDGPIELDINALVNYRDHHTRTQGTNLEVHTEAITHGLRVTTPNGLTPLYVLSSTASVQPLHDWHENLYLDAEAKRGAAAYDNDLLAGSFHATLHPGETLDIVASTDAEAELDGAKAYQTRTQYEESLITRSQQTHAPAEIRQLVLAADQFIVQRKASDNPEGRSVIAGYPWFGDWGRDTMISLPGLTLETGRTEVAAQILRTFSRFVDKGMLPNRFPDTSEVPEYNTVDATLWYFQAIRAYYVYTKDRDLLQDLFPILEQIVAWHIQGTRHQIHVDPTDGLLYAGEPGTQLTWMDAKCNGWVVTPRIGKPVEVNALWYNALKIMGDFARELGNNIGADEYDTRAENVCRSFARFWNADAGYCYDVLDGPEGHEACLRPNQIFAVSLPYSPLNGQQQKAVVDTCKRSLLTPLGLRSLAPDDPSYIGQYEGTTEQRDGAYHQGTVWSWLIGPFVEAHMRVYADAEQARKFLEPLLHEHLSEAGLGSISEVFDGNAPYLTGGCPAQAWGVAELLRAWHLTSRG